MDLCHMPGLARTWCLVGVGRKSVPWRLVHSLPGSQGSEASSIPSPAPGGAGEELQPGLPALDASWSCAHRELGLGHPLGTTWPREQEACTLWASRKVSQTAGHLSLLTLPLPPSWTHWEQPQGADLLCPALGCFLPSLNPSWALAQLADSVGFCGGGGSGSLLWQPPLRSPSSLPSPLPQPLFPSEPAWLGRSLLLPGSVPSWFWVLRSPEALCLCVPGEVLCPEPSRFVSVCLSPWLGSALVLTHPAPLCLLSCPRYLATLALGGVLPPGSLSSSSPHPLFAASLFTFFFFLQCAFLEKVFY